MRFIVFGGCGFVGTYLVKKLSEMGQSVMCCDSAVAEEHEDGKVSYRRVDIRDRQRLSCLGINADDVFINLAANQYHLKVPKDAREFFFATNVGGMRNILEEGFARGVTKVIMFSTDMTYGKPQYLPVDEKHPQHPFGFYGESKLEAEKLCRSYRDKGMQITIFRPRMIVGKGRAGILYKLFKLIDLNLPVPMIGNGLNHYQMISVYDCVSAILCAIDRNYPNEDFNLGSENQPNVRILLSGLIRSAGSRSLLIPTWGGAIKQCLALFGLLGIHLMYREQYEIADQEYILDINKAKKLLGWSPQYGDADMIREAYQEYRHKV